MRNFPSDHIASGWYVVGWSSDFPVAAPKPVSYFGHDLVVYRGTSGTVRVLDAYCKHMGAHLGYGGCVEGDSIRCPYHGWLWDAEGGNIEIPYSAPDRMARLRLGSWLVHEVDDFVFAYYSHDGTPPIYDPPPSMLRPDVEYWPVDASTTKLWLDQKISPQYMLENAADAAHFKYVHKSQDVANLAGYSAEKGVFRARLELQFGGHAAKTWATPDGPVMGRILTEGWGLGLGRTLLIAFDEIIYNLAITPTSPYSADLRSTTWIPRKRGDGSEMTERLRDNWVAQQNDQVEHDLVIWNTMSYMERAPWAATESESMRALREWVKQFYRAPALTPGS